MTPYVDLSFLEANAFGQREFVLKIIDLFMGQTPLLLQELHQALAREDWKQVGFLAHKLKASARMLGMGPLVETLETIESLSMKKRHLDRIPDLVRGAEEVGQQTLKELQRRRTDYQAIQDT
jgi:HPt (histidine-containing phosphotransfer) domain-containing protein